MRIRFHQKLSSAPGGVVPFQLSVVLLSVGCFVQPVFAAGEKETGAIEHSQPPEPGSQHATADRSGVLATKDGLTLKLTTDVGSVNIAQLDPGAAPVVRYAVHIETDARGSGAQRLLDVYSLKAKSNNSGVEIAGMLPPQAARSADAQFWVQFEVAVPRGYNVEVNTEAGDITTGRIGGAGSRDASWGRSTAKLETEGGHIQVLDVLGNLTAFTAGGHINVGNISGDASLRTGGGHVRAGQIGGRAELETAGGNITVVYAGDLVSLHTGGGHIELNETRVS